MFYGIISRININLKVRGRLKDEYTKSKSQGMKVGTLGRQNDRYLSSHFFIDIWFVFYVSIANQIKLLLFNLFVFGKSWNVRQAVLFADI